MRTTNSGSPCGQQARHAMVGEFERPRRRPSTRHVQVHDVAGLWRVRPPGDQLDDRRCSGLRGRSRCSWLSGLSATARPRSAAAARTAGFGRRGPSGEAQIVELLRPWWRTGSSSDQRLEIRRPVELWPRRAGPRDGHSGRSLRWPRRPGRGRRPAGRRNFTGSDCSGCRGSAMFAPRRPASAKSSMSCGLASGFRSRGRRRGMPSPSAAVRASWMSWPMATTPFFRIAAPWS